MSERNEEVTQNTLSTQQRTFTWDTLRSVPAGAVETVGTTFAILIADRVFDAGPNAKASLVAIPSLGLLLSLFVVQFVRRSGISANAMLAWVFGVSGVGFLAASFSRNCLDIYLAGMLFGMMGFALTVPLFSQIYRRHYPDEKRGSLFAMTSFIRKIISVIAALVFGWWLTQSLENYTWVLRAYSLASFLMIGCVLKIDQVTLDPSRVVKLFDAFRHTSQNRAFRKLLISWMILGLGNLLCFALFVEYITNERYGFSFSEKDVSVITTVIPEVLFLGSVLIWGRVFDRGNFYFLRAMINVFFALGIGFYFLGPDVWGLYVGMAFYGIARAGGNVIWTLWVTKFAKAENVAEYMSVHTFLTGCRGFIAPFIAFRLATTLGPSWVAIIGVLMIVIATLMLGSDIFKKETHTELKG